MISKKFAFVATTALVGSLMAASGAYAQSTGTTEVEQVVVTASSGPKSIEGVITAQTEPKSRTTLTQEYIAQQVPGQTILDTLNLMPGVNFTNNDAFGSAGGDINIRGFDSQRVALLQDGVPLNDSGNYAIYPNQQLDAELISKVDVNLGTTDVDSPTAAAAGGTINYVTMKPSKEFGGTLELEGGSENFQRIFGVIQTGEIGPWGTTAWFSAARAKNDIFNGPGEIDKTQYNARIYQPIGDNGDFVSVIFNWNQNRNNFIRRATLAQFNTNTIPSYDTTSCARVTPVGGTAQVDSSGSNCYLNNINPSNTGNIRGQSRFTLSDNLVLTIDPSFQYVLANGGGRTTFAESGTSQGTRQLLGNSGATGIDLNGDGDTLDTVRLYWPNTTNTRRYGVTSSVIWKFADNQSFRAAYTFDYARHRQTGEATMFTLGGSPTDVFGGKDGYGNAIDLPDGTTLRRRDRLSFATLNQFSLEYRGRFYDDRLLVNIGARAPFFKRELNNFCYQADTFNARCTTQTPTAVVGTDDGSGQTLVTFPGSSTQYGRPRHFERKYEKVLPNLGVSFKLTDDQSIYASYAQTLSAPRTDDLYDQKLTDPGPEKADVFDLGYRYQTPTFMFAGAVWYNSFSNRIERAFDEAANIFYSINVGDVKLRGFDAQAGWKPSDTWYLYGSVSFIDSELQDNIPSGLGTTYPTKGKELYETPRWQASIRVSHDFTDDLQVGIQAKKVGDRFTNLTNTEVAPGYTVWDLDARYSFASMGWDKGYVQLNVKNLFDEGYLGDISTNISGTGQFQPGYPRAITLTLHAGF